MNLRLEMVQVARVAPKILGASTDQVVRFLRSQQPASGGFCDRAGASDLYYTVFGIDGLQALQQTVADAQLVSYVQRFGEGEDLDLVHLSCLCRCWAALPEEVRRQGPMEQLAERIIAHRTDDGGFDVTPGASQGNVYACFLAVGALEDLGWPLPDPEGLLTLVNSLRDPQGGYWNSRDMPMSLVPQTAAAVTLLRHLGQRHVDLQVAEWFLSCLPPQGGFRAEADILTPDLLSTATALHALASFPLDLAGLVESCLDFVDSLWTNRGGFFGHWEDSQPDVEYTYYALLSLGHLALLSPRATE